MFGDEFQRNFYLLSMQLNDTYIVLIHSGVRRNICVSYVGYSDNANVASLLFVK